MKNRPLSHGWSIALVLALALGAALGAALLTGGPESAVDWRALRAVVVESDDWGLSGFAPAADVWQGLDRNALAPGNFPDVYWNSTLEDSATIKALGRILNSVRGRDGRPAVFQPNYVMSALDYEEGPQGTNWRRYDIPDLPPQYPRPGLWGTVTDVVNGGLWYPEYHAAWHYDPERRRQAVAEGGVAEEAARRGIPLFTGSEAARELGSWRSSVELERELEQGLYLFEEFFQRRPGSLIAPDYTWNGRMENIWEGSGLTVIQAKREQRNPDLGNGRLGRLQKYVYRQVDRRWNPGRIYLERNCRLEPVQALDPSAVIDDCITATFAAWSAGQPAIVETHRVNFVHLDPAVAETGQRALAEYLHAVGGATPGPVFLTDMELAQLYRRGTAWCVRGGMVVVGNGTHSRRLVTIPGHALELAASQRGIRAAEWSDLIVALAAGEWREVVPGDTSVTPSHN